VLKVLFHLPGDEHAGIARRKYLHRQIGRPLNELVGIGQNARQTRSRDKRDIGREHAAPRDGRPEAIAHAGIQHLAQSVLFRLQGERQKNAPAWPSAGKREFVLQLEQLPPGSLREVRFNQRMAAGETEQRRRGEEDDGPEANHARLATRRANLDESGVARVVGFIHPHDADRVM